VRRTRMSIIPKAQNRMTKVFFSQPVSGF